MQKWEYLFVFADITSDGGEFRPRFVNDEELNDWQAGPAMYDYANRLGESGWELFSCEESRPAGELLRARSQEALHAESLLPLSRGAMALRRVIQAREISAAETRPRRALETARNPPREARCHQEPIARRPASGAGATRRHVA